MASPDPVACTGFKAPKTVSAMSFDTFVDGIERSRRQAHLDPSTEEDRQRVIKSSDTASPASILCWTVGDVRAHDNWTLLIAQRRATTKQCPLFVFMNMDKNDEQCPRSRRLYELYMSGAKQYYEYLRLLNIKLYMTVGNATQNLNRLVRILSITDVFVDYSPFKYHQSVLKDFSTTSPENLSIFEIDAHYVVPAWRTRDVDDGPCGEDELDLLSKVYLCEYPQMAYHTFNPSGSVRTPHGWWDEDEVVSTFMGIDETVPKLSLSANDANRKLFELIYEPDKKRFNSPFGLATTGEDDDGIYVESLISFGHLSASRCLLEIAKAPKSRRLEKFIKKLTVARVRAENFCTKKFNYDLYDGAPDRPKAILDGHRQDERPDLENPMAISAATTSDSIWNAIQRQLIYEGNIEEPLRGTWAYRWLHMAPNPETAWTWALDYLRKYYLNSPDASLYYDLRDMMFGQDGQETEMDLPVTGTLTSRDNRNLIDVHKYEMAFRGDKVMSK